MKKFTELKNGKGKAGSSLAMCIKMENNKRNIKLVLEYDGSRYDGWQKIPGSEKSITVQDKIEQVLSKMTGEAIDLIGAVRTEPGVHAACQIANFKTVSTMKFYEIRHYLNRYLPRDIAVLEVMEVPERFHSALLAKKTVYEYRITVGEHSSVFSRKYNYYSFDAIDILNMKKGAAFLIGKHDLKAFSDNKRMKKSTIRELFSIEIYGDGREISITIEADDFWPHMARILVGLLIEVGKGERLPEDVKRVLETGERADAGTIAEAKGLFLTDVIYE